MSNHRQLLGQASVPEGIDYTIAAPNADGLDMLTSARLREPLEVDDHARIAAARISESAVSRLVAGTCEHDPKQLFSQIEDVFRQSHATSDPNVYLLSTLFVLSSYVFMCARTVPYLHLIGPVGSGKTSLAEVFEGLAFNARMAASLTKSALYELVEFTRGTLIFDESDLLERRLSKLLCDGYRHTGSVMFISPGKRILTERSTFSPKIFVTNHELRDDALRSRTLQLVTQPAPPGFRSRVATPARLAALRDDLHIFGLLAARDVSALLQDTPTLDGIRNRDLDLVELPLAICRYVDRQPGAELDLASRLVEYLQNRSKERASAEKVSGLREVLAGLIVEFLSNTKLPPVYRSDEGEWHLAELFRRYVNGTGVLFFERTEDLGSQLRHHGLLRNHAVVDVKSAEHLGQRQINGRVQRTAYLFRQLEADQVAKGRTGSL